MTESSPPSDDRSKLRALVPVSREHEPEFDVLQSTQVLEPGYYWTATKPVERCADVDDTLLLLDVIDFEDKPHTVKIAFHPAHGEGSFDMLVDSFLDSFVPCHDAEAVRQREQQEIMARVSDLQAELIETQTNPQLMIAAVKDAVEQEITRAEYEEKRAEDAGRERRRERTRDISKMHRRAARRSEAKGNPLVAPRAALASDIGSVIGAGVNDEGLAEMRKVAQQQAIVARAQANWLTAKTEEIAKTLGRLAPFVKERAAVALARSSGAIKMAERIKSGIESLDLYTGEGVDVFDVRLGTEAPSGEPLTLVQSKRYMDEELAVILDIDGSFDCSNKELFFDELARNETLLNTVFPTQRCVVSMAVTRHERDYSNRNPFEAAMYALENRRVFLLVRNGGNVHAVYSSTPSHEAARRLFPTDDELGGVFRGVDGSRIGLKDVEFSKASARFDDLALHYRRFLILLTGLDHRLGLFGRFYPPEMQAKFMSAEFQQSYFRFLADDEAGWMIGADLEPVDTWMARKNAAVQTGSRVFLLGCTTGMFEATPELKRRRSTVTTTERQFFEHFIASKDANKFYVPVEVTERYSGTAPKDVWTAKCYLDPEADAHDNAWWICVDAVGLEEVRRYQGSRNNRAMGVSYLRLFRRLERHLAGEAEAEMDARAYLLSNAIEHGRMTPDVAQQTLDTAVRNWRASRRGAPLPKLDDVASLNEVLTLMVPAGQMTEAFEAMFERFLETSRVTPLLLVRSGKAKYLLYAEATVEDRAPYPADVLTWRWVKRMTLEVGKSKIKEGSSTLVWLGTVLPASEVELHRWDGLAAWMNQHDEPMTLRKYGKLPELLARSAEWEATLRGGEGGGVEPSLFVRVLGQVRKLRLQARSDYYLVPRVYIPVAISSKDGRTLSTAYMTESAERVLHYYGTAEQRTEVLRYFRERYRSTTERERRIVQPVKWGLVESSEEVTVAHDSPVKESLSGLTSPPDWAKHSIQKNRKRHRPGKRDDGKPLLNDATATLSLDRAFAGLVGLAPMMRRAFYERARKQEKDLRWPFFGSLDDDADTREAKVKAQRKEILDQRFVHRYKAALSPLVWSAERGRAVANKTFVAPRLQATAQAKEDANDKT